MMFSKLFYLFLFVLVTFNFSFAQDSLKSQSLNVDVLESLIESERIEKLINLTDSLLTSEPELSLKYANESLRLSEKLEDEESKLTILIQLAAIYKNDAKLVTALYYANQAKALSLKLNNEKKHVEVLLIFGSIYSMLGDYEKCAKYNYEALKVSTKINFMVGVANSFNNIAGMYAAQKDFDKAIEYYTLSLMIARQNSDYTSISRNLNNLAAIYISQGEYKKAELLLREAAKLNKMYGRKLWEAANYNNLGDVFRITKKYDSAFFYYEKAVSIGRAFNNIPYLVTFYISLSEYYYEKDNPGKMLFYANQAFEICKNSNLKISIYMAAQNLHSHYIQLNDSANAYKYAVLELQMKDSLGLEKSGVLLSQLDQLYQNEKKEKEIKLVQQRKYYTNIILGTILFSLLIFLTLVIVARNRIKVKNALIEKKKLENDIEIKNKELTSNVVFLMRKNEILSDIAGKLMNIQLTSEKEETKNEIKRIVKELQNSIDKEVWKEFDTRFRQVHTDFFDKLIVQFPDLTPTEMRLCAFLRLNMTSKEISELTGQRISTLEVARSRIRKKLGIANVQSNLVTFLSKI